MKLPCMQIRDVPVFVGIGSHSVSLGLSGAASCTCQEVLSDCNVPETWVHRQVELLHDAAAFVCSCRFVAASRNVALLPTAYRYNFYSMPDWWFLVANARTPVTTAFTYSLDLQVH